MLSGCTQPKTDASAAKPVTGSAFAFDTYCTFGVYGDDTAPARLADACAHFDALFDLYDEKSDIARINAAAGEPVRVHADTVDLLLAAKTYCGQADGLFDVTIGAVSTLWDFTEGVRPAPEAIADALPHVDWRCIEIDEEALTVRLADPQAKLDLGGIAKGYVADRLCDLLRDETNATGAVLSLGGNIALFGEKPNGEPWETGVRDPNDPGGDTVVGTARVQGGSLVTSGLYERVFEQDGITYWHILDPRTGEPSRPTWRARHRAQPVLDCRRRALDHAVRGRQPPRRRNRRRTRGHSGVLHPARRPDRRVHPLARTHELLVSNGTLELADHADLGLEVDAEPGLHLGLHVLDETEHVLRTRAARVDHEPAMFLAHLRIAPHTRRAGPRP